MALSEHPNPTAAWAAAARWLLALEEPARTAMVALSREAYRGLTAVPSVAALVDAYHERGADERLWEQAKLTVPSVDPARACRVARDAAYFRRYRELLDGQTTPRSARS